MVTLMSQDDAHFSSCNSKETFLLLLLLSFVFCTIFYPIIQVGLDCFSYIDLSSFVLGRRRGITNQIWNRERERGTPKRRRKLNVLPCVRSLWYWIIDKPLAGDWRCYVLRQQLKFFSRDALQSHEWMMKRQRNATEGRRGEESGGGRHELWYRSRCVCESVIEEGF